MGRVHIRTIIESYKRHGSIRGASKELGIDRKTVRKWIRSARSGATPRQLVFRDLKRKSTRPHRAYKVFSFEQEV